MELSSDSLFKEICVQNGVDIYGDGDNYEEFNELYALFSGISDLPPLQKFVNLTELAIISQSLRRITNLDGCPNLRILWICECELRKIESLECCKMLEELYLYGNNIEKIENLDKLIKLSVLWLNENQISYIDGISGLENLQELNLSDNLIKTFGRSLENNTKLKALHISGNMIEDFKEIVNLSRLPQLSSLSINECGFKRNPICANSNLPLILMYHLPRLRTLDSVRLDSTELRHAVKAVMSAKQGFYCTRAQHILGVQDYRQGLLTESYKCIEAKIMSQIQQLDKTMKSLQYRHGLKSKIEYGVEVQESFQTTQYINELQTRITFWEYMINKYEEELEFASQVLKQHTRLKYNLLQLELELCGYFEFVEGSTNDEWFHRCSKLIASRFCLHHPYAVPVAGIRVHHAYKVCNKLLQQKFEAYEKEHSQLDENYHAGNEENFSNAGMGDCSQEYLITVCPKSQKKETYFPELLKSGIKFPIEGAPLTNSLSLADEENLGDLLKIYSTNKHWTPNRFTTVLLIRANTSEGSSPVFLKKTDDALNKSEFKTLKNFQCSEGNCSCQVVNKSYMFPEEKCLLPEFVIELEYLTKHEIVSPFYQILISGTAKWELPSFEEDIKTDNSLLKKVPHRLVRPITLELSDSALDLWYNDKAKDHTGSITLALNDIKCPRYLNLQRFKDLTHLRLTHCCLQKLPSLGGLNLVLIDFSYNKIASLKLLPNLQKLVSLDVRHNSLSSLLEELESMQTSLPKIRELNLCFNPWKRKENIHSLVAAMLPELETLDCKNITKEDKAEGWKLLTRSKLDAKLLHSDITSTSVPLKEYPFLSVGSVAHYLVDWSRTISKVATKNTWNTIISVCLCNCNLQRLENMERLVNLRYLNVDSNHLKSLEGISQCANLEEISAEHNFLSGIDELQYLKKLKRLLLGNNTIKSLSAFQEGSFTSLQIICLRSNSISRLNGLNVCKGLKEMYLGNNHISELKTILQLKSLPNLIVINLYGNPITQKLENYRFRIIHHLKGIKSLDGCEVRPCEVAQSKELLGGHLSNELIMDKLDTDHFSSLIKMDMPNMSLKVVDYLSPESFRRLQSVNLEKNQLTSFGGLLFLSELRVLCLNENLIESLFPKNIYLLADSAHYKSNDPTELQYLALYKSTQAIFPYLQVVHLAKNQISSLEPFHFHRMPALRSLFLQYNEIVNITGLEGLHQLRELVLDGNRIKEIGEVSFFYNWSLQEIHLENNRLKELQSLNGLESLKRLYVGGNKLCNLHDLEIFAQTQKNLVEISVVDNPITAKQLHRLILVHGLPRLQSIDGIPITPEEKDRANAFYADQELQNMMNSNGVPITIQQVAKPGVIGTDIALPGINTQKTALLTSKLTSGAQVTTSTVNPVRPGYSIVTIGSQLEISDSSTFSNRTLKPAGTHPRTYTTQNIRADNCNSLNGISQSANSNTTSEGPQRFHNITSQNLPGTSVKSLDQRNDHGRS